MNLLNKRLFAITIAVITVLAVVLPMASAQNVVTIATRANPQVDAQFKQIIDRLNAQSSDYQIVHTPVSGDFQTQIKSEANQGSGADIYWVNQEDMSLALEDNFQSLNMCMAHKPRYTVGDMSDYHSQIIETGVINQIMYGLPIISSPVVAYINLDLFNQAGVTAPTRYWNWNEFAQIAKSLTKDTNGDGTIDQWGFVADGWPPPQIFIWQAGGDIISGDLTSAPIDSAPALQALDFYRSFAPARQSAPSNMTAEQLFRAGKMAMFLGSATDDFAGVGSIGMQVVPRSPVTNKQTTFAWTELLAVSKNATNPAVCDAIQEVGEALQEAMGASPRISHATAQMYATLNPSRGNASETVLNSMQQMRSPRIFENQASYENIFWSNLVGALVNPNVQQTTEEIVAMVKPMLETNLR